MLKNQRFKGKKSNHNFLNVVFGFRKNPCWYKNDVDWFISILRVALSCYMVVWIDIDGFLYKGNVGFLGEMLSKFCKTHVFLFLP